MQAIVIYQDGRHSGITINGLSDMRKILEGGIELFDSGLEGVYGYCNEFSKFECLPNMKATKIWHNLWGGDTGDTLYGNILFCRDEEDLRPEDIRAIRKASEGEYKR